jgi:hypothetical protein
MHQPSTVDVARNRLAPVQTVSQFGERWVFGDFLGLGARRWDLIKHHGDYRSRHAAREWPENL